MSYSRMAHLRILLALLVVLGGSETLAADKKPQPPPPAHAKSPVPAVTDEYIHKEFGDNCSLLSVHGVGPEGWRSDKTKPKFLLINLPFKTLTVKRLALKKKTVLGVYMEEQGEGEATSSVIFWDGKKYRYQILGADME